MNKSPIEEAKNGMRKGMLEFCVLLTISGKKIYSSDILKQLKDADLLVVEGTIYPLLNRLKTEEILEYSWEESKAGPPRKYYALTAKGEETLTQLKKSWQSLSASITSLLHEHL